MSSTKSTMGRGEETGPDLRLLGLMAVPHGDAGRAGSGISVGPTDRLPPNVSLEYRNRSTPEITGQSLLTMANDPGEALSSLTAGGRLELSGGTGSAGGVRLMLLALTMLMFGALLFVFWVMAHDTGGRH